MTETPDAEATSADTAVVENGTSSDAPPDTDTSNPNHEAAKWRTRLRDTEAERDALAERLASAQRQNVDTVVSQRFADAADFWSVVDLADVLGDDGEIDPERLTTAMDSALAAKPHWKRPASATESASTVTSRERVGGGKTPSWSDLLQGKLR